MPRLILCMIALLLHLQAVAGVVISINDKMPLKPVLSMPLTQAQLSMLKEQGIDKGKEMLGLYLVTDGKVAEVPVVGVYSIEDMKLLYSPRYNLGYDLEFVAKAVQENGMVMVKKYHTPTNPTSSKKAIVVSAYPLADTIPYNTLFFHVHFSQRMLNDRYAYKHIKMYDAKGEERTNVWRQKSFWLDGGKLLVLMIHPGRVKNGIHYESPLFDSGSYYTLKVLSSIKDENGNGLKKGFEQRYFVVGEDRAIPQMNKFYLKQPSANTKQPLSVFFSEGMDYASVLAGVKVVDEKGRSVGCKISVGKTDKSFMITPIAQWRKGAYTLMLNGGVYDYSGNRINRPFEITDAKEIEKDAQVNKWSFEVR